ncbi:MAG: DUF2207 domain-containing protein [Micromonosporaceae bacterium]
MSAAAAVVMTSILAVQTGASAQTGPEKIVSYDVAIAIQRDASIVVTEQIVYDFGSNERHGIIREIPVLYGYNKRYDRYYPLEVRSVQSPDAPAQYTVDNNGSSVIIKIGNPGQTVTGAHTYRLTYLVRGSMDAYTGYDELYWDAIGDQWYVPVGRATVRVTAPAAPTDAACWAGPSGSENPCQQADVANGAATFTQAGLGPHEALTVAVEIPKGVVAPPRPVLREQWSLQRAFALTPVSLGACGGLLAVLMVLGTLLVVRRRRRQHAVPAPDLTGAAPAPSAEPVAPPGSDQSPMELAPPDGVRPGLAGTLLDGVANPRDVTATIVDLAVRGYLRIEDAGGTASGDWRLVWLDKTGWLQDYEQIVVDGLFRNATEVSGAPSVRLSELGSEFAAQLKRAQDALYAFVTKRGWFTARPDRVRRKWLAIGAVMFVAGVIAVVVAAYGTHHLGLVPLPLALAGLAMMIGSGRMPVRTAEGAALARRVEGFRRYLKTAAVAQAPSDGQPGTLYDDLPYAIAFGCTREWAALTGSLARAGQAPSWYQPRAPFTPASLYSLSQFAAGVDKVVATTTSGGGGGGGFSGGGGGGGGGGSW